MTISILPGNVAVEVSAALTTSVREPLHGHHTHAGIEMTIAGHRSPVRIDPANGKMDDDFVNAAKEFLLASV